MKKYLNIIFYSFVFIFIFAVSTPVVYGEEVSGAQGYGIMEAIPGFFQAGSSISLRDMISAIYKFGIWTVGIAAMFMIVIGGFMYATSAGNTSTASSAKTVITDALLGLAVAMLAYGVLNIINPDLVEMRALTGGGTGASPERKALPAGTLIGENCNPGTPCENCEGVCEKIDNCKPQANETCSLSAELAKIVKPLLPSLNMQLTEGWPPTIRHESPGHKNGTCADINFIGGDNANRNPDMVKKAFDQITKTGIRMVRYESANCPAYRSIGVACTPISKPDEAHFHICL